MNELAQLESDEECLRGVRILRLDPGDDSWEIFAGIIHDEGYVDFLGPAAIAIDLLCAHTGMTESEVLGLIEQRVIGRRGGIGAS